MRHLLLCLVLVVAVPASAQEVPLDLPQLTDAQLETYKESTKKATKLYREGRHARAIHHAKRALSIHDGDEGAWYNLACTQALANQREEALASLKEASARGWNDAVWPTRDGDLAILHDDLVFERWIESVKDMKDEAAPWPTFARASLASDEDTLDESSEAANKAISRVRAVIGRSGITSASRQVAAWKAASWDHIATTMSGDERTEASYEAIKIIAGRRPSSLSATSASELLRRSDSFLSSHPRAEESGKVELLRAEARHALARRDDKKAAAEGLRAELKGLADKHHRGETAEGALVRLFELSKDMDEARPVHARLMSIAEDADETRQALAGGGARGMHYKIDGLPRFEATRTDGVKLTRNSFQGKVTLVDFWATWCGPCIAEMPHLKAAAAKYADRKFEILGISLDNEKSKDLAAFQSWCSENGVSWPQVYDGKGWDAELAETFGVRSIPFPMLLDANGNVVATDGELRGPNLEKSIEKALESLENPAVGF
ncbi:MAG: TlpA disulfide reductase family protein [Acidobacteriota bacterium]